jgi:hypothetical protein
LLFRSLRPCAHWQSAAAMQRGRAQHIVVVFVVDLRVSAFADSIMISSTGIS